MKTYIAKVQGYTFDTEAINLQDAIEIAVYEMAQEGIKVTANDIELVLE